MISAIPRNVGRHTKNEQEQANKRLELWLVGVGVLPTVLHIAAATV